MIEFKDVHMSYDGTRPILKGLNFTIADGDFVAFVGTNGAGKSTAMRLINGLLKPDAGEVLIDGVPTTQLKTSELAKRVGFLFQNPDRQICCSTVRDELLFGFKAQDSVDEQAHERVQAACEEFGLSLDDDPFLLNRGARQLLALASVVVMAPPIVILDEPTTGLDFRECERVMQAVKRLNEAGTTVVMVCHDMEVVADYALRCLVMHDGQLIGEGPTFSVLRNRSLLNEASLIPPQVVDIALRLIDEAPALKASPVCQANTLDEMIAATHDHLQTRKAG